MVAQVLGDFQAQANGALKACLSLGMDAANDAPARNRAAIPSSAQLIVARSFGSLFRHLIQSHLDVVVSLHNQIGLQSDTTEDGISSGQAEASWLQSKHAIRYRR